MNNLETQIEQNQNDIMNVIESESVKKECGDIISKRLSVTIIEQIFIRYYKDRISSPKLAKEFNIQRKVVNRIVNRCIYEKITEPYIYLIKEYQNLFDFRDPNEIWKDILGYEGYYQISNKGNIRSVFRIIKRQNGVIFNIPSQEKIQSFDTEGYKTIGLNKNSKKKTCKIHRLVAINFIPNPNNLPEVNHKDLNKLNNNLNNLEWSTGEDNRNHAIREYRKLGINIYGNSHLNRKTLITVDVVKEIRYLFNNNICSIRKIAKNFKIHVKTASDIVNRRTWKTV